MKIKFTTNLEGPLGRHNIVADGITIGFTEAGSEYLYTYAIDDHRPLAHDTALIPPLDFSKTYWRAQQELDIVAAYDAWPKEPSSARIFFYRWADNGRVLLAYEDGFRPIA
jgi:hypothetical protein